MKIEHMKSTVSGCVINKLHTLHLDEIPLGSHKSKQMFVYMLQTKYKLLRACTLRGSLSQSFNIISLSTDASQLCVFQNFNVLITPVGAVSTWISVLDLSLFW